MEKSIINRIRSNIKPENRIFVSLNLDISQQIYSMLKKKGMSQKDLAKAIGKSESEISKWLSGTHNITLMSLAKIQAILGDEIILTADKAKEKYDTVKYKVYKVKENYSLDKNSTTKPQSEYLGTEIITVKPKTLNISAA